MAVKITYDNSLKCFLGKCAFDERHHFKKNNWSFDKNLPKPYVWYTKSLASVAPLLPYCDDVAKKKLNANVNAVTKYVGPLAIPKWAKLEPYQVGAARFALWPHARSKYLGLDPGLGKTIVASVVLETLYQQKEWEKDGQFIAAYVCPPNLVKNVTRELTKWTTLKIVSWKAFVKAKYKLTNFSVLIFPDSMIQNDVARLALISLGVNCLVIDEAHRFKSFTAQRTTGLLGDEKWQTMAIINSVHKDGRIIPMSGTPMPNRPIELYPVLSKLAPESIDYMTQHDYGVKFCNAFHDGFGWNYKGNSNLKELKARTSTNDFENPDDKFMLRLRKSLLKLPPVIEETVILDDTLTKELKGIEEQIFNYGVDNIDWANDGFSFINEDGEKVYLATYFRKLGEAKVAATASYLKDILDETDEKLLVFGLHKIAIAMLSQKLAKYKPLVITGDTPFDTRQAYVDRFQENKNERLIIGNVDAMGIGYNITKATQVYFFEWKWGGYENRQAIDRVHRFGFEGGSLLVRYLAFEDSLDLQKLEVVAQKNEVTNTFDGQT